MNPVKDHNHNPSFPATLRRVYQSFREQYSRDKTQTELFVNDENNGGHRHSSRFLGVCMDARPEFDCRKFRQSLGRLLRLTENEHDDEQVEFSMVQVVGDSGRQLSPAGVVKARQSICQLVDDSESCQGTKRKIVLEYGYTCTENDTNWCVNDVLASDSDLARSALANVVYMSSTAVEQWSCEATSYVSNFVMAFDMHRETAFGDDMWLSDLLMSTDSADRMLCLEGGPQAFSQASTVCSRGVPVFAVTGPQMRLQDEQSSSLSRFSAAELLQVLHAGLLQCHDIDRVTEDERIWLVGEGLKYLDKHDDLRLDKNRSKYELIKAGVEALTRRPECLQNIHVDVL